MPNPITAAARALFGRSPVQQSINPTQEVGVSGTPVFSGFVQVLERNPKLVGQNRYRITSDIFVNTSIVAAGIRYFLDLCAKPAWSVEPADDSAQAKEAAEFAEACLYDLSASWTRTVRKAAEFRFHGFGIQEWTAKIRDDGRIGFESIEARPQHTIWRWEVDEKGTIEGIYQRNPLNGQEIFLPRQKVIYLVDDTMTDSPEGLGVLRHLVEPAERLREYLRLEGKGFETDLRGIPIARAPLAELAAMVKAETITQTVADAIKKPLIDFIQNHIRSDKSGLLLDSKTYFSQGDNPSPSTVPTTSVELLNGDAAAFADIGKAIERINHELAVILGVENMLLGSGGQAGGSRALSQDKSEHLYLVVNSCLGDIAEGMERDFLGPLWLLNGLDPALKPTLKCEDVQYKDVAEITTALQQMAQAGAVLAPDDPAINDVRGLLGVSPQPEPDPAMMGVRAGGVPGADFASDQPDEQFGKRRRHREHEDEGGERDSQAHSFGEIEFDPSKHPRGVGGRFTGTGGGKDDGGSHKDVAGKPLRSADDLSDEEKKAIYDYTGADYDIINRSLRGQLGEVERWTRNGTIKYQEEFATDKIDALDAIMSRASLPESTTVYRGISGGAAKALKAANLKVGDEIEDAGFVSATTRKEYAQNVTKKWGGVVMMIDAPKGARALDVSSASRLPEEKEVLLNRSSRFRVKSWNPETSELELEMLQ